MPYNNASFTQKSTNTFSKLRSSIDLAKFSGNAIWQFTIFLSLAIVLQALGSNRSVNALDLDISVTQQSIGQAKDSNSTRRRDSILLPRILNLIAAIKKSQPVEFIPRTPDKFESTAPKLAPLQPIAQSQRLYSADTKSLTKPAPPQIHQVKRGETITAIANEYRVSSNELVKLNRLANSNVIFVNQRLAIPANDNNKNTALDTEKSLDFASVELAETETNLAPKTLSNNAKTKLLQPSVDDPYITQLRIEIEQRRAQYKQEQSAEFETKNSSLISAVEPLSEDEDLQPESSTPAPQTQLSSSAVRRNLKSDTEDSLALALPPLLNSDEYLPSAFDGYIWPAQGVFTSGYGWRWGRLHRGIDIAAPVGTPIVAAAAGEVVGAGWHGGYGNLVKLEHLDGSVTYYAHNNRILVTHGQKVKQGEQIAEMGSTGHSTGSHLHFEIHLRDKTVTDPLALLGSR